MKYVRQRNDVCLSILISLQIFVYLTLQKVNVNKNLMAVDFGTFNETYNGAITVEFFQDLPVFVANIKFENEAAKIIDFRVNICKITDNRVNFVSSFFKNFYEKFYDPKFFTCPIKKGRFVAVQPKPRQFEVSKLIPSFLSFSGNVTLTLNLQSRIAKKTVDLYTSVELVEFSQAKKIET